MADNRQFSLQTVIRTSINGVECEVSVLADTARELKSIIAELTGQQATQAQPAPQPEAQPAPTPAVAQQTQAQPQPTPTAQPGPSAEAAAPEAAATHSATATAEQPSQPELTVNDLLGPARQLLQLQNGEDSLRKILAATGAEAISQADPAKYGHIKWAVEQVLAGQDLDTVLNSLA